jgi:hypothetical protein
MLDSEEQSKSRTHIAFFHELGRFPSRNNIRPMAYIGCRHKAYYSSSWLGFPKRESTGLMCNSNAGPEHATVESVRLWSVPRYVNRNTKRLSSGTLASSAYHLWHLSSLWSYFQLCLGTFQQQQACRIERERERFGGENPLFIPGTD